MNYFRHLRLRLFEMGLMPTGKVARTAWYLLGLNLLLFALQKLLGLFKLSYGESLTGWVLGQLPADEEDVERAVVTVVDVAHAGLAA